MLLQIKTSKLLKEGGVGIRIFIFLSRKLLYFFLDLCDYSDKFPKMFCSLCGWECPSTANCINVEILKEKYKKAQCFSSNLRKKSMIKYISYKNLTNLLRQLLSCKISHKIQLKNLKYLPPQSLACEVYRKQENGVKYLLPQSRRTRKTIKCNKGSN